MKNLSNYIIATAIYALAVVLWLGPNVIPHADAARENDVWVERLGTYVESVWNEGRDVLINGSNKYLNFGSISGTSGYGFRDNAGTIEFKNSGGSWAGVGSGGGGGGDSISIDSVAVTDPDFVSTGDIDFVDTSNTVTANINAGAIINADVNASAAIALSKLDLTGYTGATSITTLGTVTTGVWQATALTDTYVSDTITIGASGSVNDAALSAKLEAIAGLVPASSLIIGDGLGSWTTVTPANFITDNSILDTADISVSVQAYDADLAAIAALAKTDSNFIVGNGSTWVAESGATARTSLGLGSLATLSTITTSEITNDTITHANIADSDQTFTQCKYIESPTDADDLQSLWANKTANDWTITAIWAESDQTVAFDLQVDDGTPADVNGTDITPTAGEAEDTSLSGDTTLAAGEELDLAVTSVSGSPTWISICPTFQFND